MQLKILTMTNDRREMGAGDVWMQFHTPYFEPSKTDIKTLYIYVSLETVLHCVVNYSDAIKPLLLL